MTSHQTFCKKGYPAFVEMISQARQNPPTVFELKLHDPVRGVKTAKRAAVMLNLAAFGTDCFLLLPFRSGSEIRPMLNPVMWLFWELIGVCSAISVLIPPRQRHAWWIAGFNLCPMITGLLTFWGIIWLKGFILEP